MTKTTAPRRLERQASDLAEQQGNTQAVQPEPLAVQPEPESVQPEPLPVQAAEPLPVQAEPDPIAELKLEIEQAIASPQTHTAAALADLCQVSSATIRNRWSDPVSAAIAPYALRAADGKYTDLAAWAFADYRATVAIDTTTKAAWIEQVQALLPARQLELTEIDEEPEALAIVPRAEAAIVVDSDWLDQTGEAIDARLDQIGQLQIDLSTTIATAGNALEQAMRRLADEHSLGAMAAYQSQLQQNMASILGANTAAATGKKQTAGSAA